jgi:MFS family permease
MLQSPPSIETKESWRVATAALFTTLFAFGSAWIAAVALKEIAAEADGVRTVPSLALAMVWLCAGVGGTLMGRVANRFSTRLVVLCGTAMVATGLLISTLGAPYPLWIGHGVFIGLLGLGAINAPLYVYVTYWFDRRRGSALALISSGSYLAGALWPPIFERFIAMTSWRTTMIVFALVQLVVIVPLAALVFKAPPVAPAVAVPSSGGQRNRVLGWPPNLVFALICIAGFTCCIPMGIPQQHLVAFCSDLGFSRTFGAWMLTVLLGTAFLSRQIWGVISDRIGGVATILVGSIWQTLAMMAFLLSLGEFGLIMVSAAFGLGFSGILPAYALAVRELYPAKEAYWRIPVVLMCTAFGMAAGGSIAGALYDYFGYYMPAFAVGVLANLINVAIVGALVLRRHGRRPSPPLTASATT